MEHSFGTCILHVYKCIYMIISPRSIIMYFMSESVQCLNQRFKDITLPVKVDIYN